MLRGATSKIVGDLTQEIREKLEPLMIPPQPSPISVGMSPHRVQANHLTAGLTNTLGSLSDAFPWGAGHGTLRWTRASEQAGKALRSQGHQCAHVM